METREEEVSYLYATSLLFKTVYYNCWGICQDQKINATLRRDNTILKVIIALTLKEFCFRVKSN